MKLRGIFPPLTTPFSADGDVDFARLRENVRRYAQTRISGFVINGSTGESVLLGWDEVEKIWATAREASPPEKLMIAGTGAESTAETIRHTKRAAALGFNVALVRTPSYYKPAMSFEAEVAHFFRVADASPIPVLIYSVPVFTGYTVEAPLAAKLATHPNIIGIKESSGNVQRMKEIVSSTPKGFNALSGSGVTIAEAVGVGAVGGILAISCMVPDACADLYEAARRGEKQEIEQIKKQFINPAAALVTNFGISGIKFALDRLGYYGGPPRPPLLPISDSARSEIEALVAALHPVTASSALEN